MYVYVYMYVCVYVFIYIYIRARVGVHMHSCRRILFFCTVRSLYYMHVYHRYFLTPACVCSVASSGVRGWHLIRSRAATIFCLTTSLAALISPFLVPQYRRYLHASSKFIAWSFSPLIVNSSTGSYSLCCSSFPVTNKYFVFTFI